MPRRSRNYLPGHTYHLVQRGINKSETFLEPIDFVFYTRLWKQYAEDNGLAVHAYCLMTNHIHFLVTPVATDSISKTARQVGSNYASYFNRKNQRTGTLWEGRHKSNLIDSDRYLLSCYRYIELNPVRAGLSLSVTDYEWSSYRHNSTGHYDWLTPHPLLISLGTTGDSRSKYYRALFASPLQREIVDGIRIASSMQKPLASQDFTKSLEREHQISFGRPIHVELP